jgi:tetratricopeptide (TPR) repeat protein
MRERTPDVIDLNMRTSAILLSNNPSKSSWNDAIAMCERALVLDPQNTYATINLSAALAVRADVGWSEDRASDIARADDLINAALAVWPDDTWVHWTKGYIFSIKRQWRSALTETEMAIADDPSNAKAYGNGGAYKMLLGRSAEGVTDIEMALRLSPRDNDAPRWQASLCWLRAHLAQWDKAIDECEKAVAAARDSGSLGTLAAAYAWAGHDKEAKDVVAKAREADPYFRPQDLAGLGESDDPTYKAEAARIVEGLRKAGATDWNLPLTQAEKAIADDPTNAKVRADAGLYKMFLGRSAEGVTDIETALHLSPHDNDAPEWQGRLCYLLAHLAQWERAIEECNKAVALARPGDWGSLADLTTAYAWAGRDKEAKETAAKAHKLYPSIVQEVQANMDAHDDPTYKAEMGRIMEGLRKAGLQ